LFPLSAAALRGKISTSTQRKKNQHSEEKKPALRERKTSTQREKNQHSEKKKPALRISTQRL